MLDENHLVLGTQVDLRHNGVLSLNRVDVAAMAGPEEDASLILVVQGEIGRPETGHLRTSTSVQVEFITRAAKPVSSKILGDMVAPSSEA